MVRVNDSGTIAADAPANGSATQARLEVNANLGTVAGIASASGEDSAPVEVFPVVSLVGPPSPRVGAAALPDGSPRTFFTAEQTGASSLDNESSGVLVAVPSLAPPPLPASVALPANVAALLALGISGQGNLTFTAVGSGDPMPVDGGAAIAMQIPDPLFVSWNASYAYAKIQVPAAAVATSGSLVAMSGSFLLAPLVSDTLDGDLRIALSGAGAAGAAANLGNAGTVMEIGTAGLGPIGPSTALGNAGRMLARDPTLALFGSRLAAMVIGRDAHDWPSQDVVDTAEPDPRSIWDAADPFDLRDLAPQRLGLILDFRPFPQLAVEQTIDQFLEQLERLGAGLTAHPESMEIAAELMALAVVLTAWKVVPRILRRSPGERTPTDCDDATSLDGISGLPGSTIPEEPDRK